MPKAISTAMLLLALSCSTYAGEMQNGITGTTTTTQGEMQTGVYGEIQNGAPGNMPNGETDTSSQDTTQSTLDGVEITFSLLQGLLGLL